MFSYIFYIFSYIFPKGLVASAAPIQPQITFPPFAASQVDTPIYKAVDEHNYASYSECI